MGVGVGAGVGVGVGPLLTSSSHYGMVAMHEGPTVDDVNATPGRDDDGPSHATISAVTFDLH